MAANDETTPLLGIREVEATKSKTKFSLFTPATLVLLGGFLISMSFSYTQTPLIYTFHVMVCEEFYKHAPPFEGPGDRCARNEIDAGAARQVATMGSATVICGITNLFVAGWEMRKYGPKKALAIQTFFPAIRVVIQATALFIGARAGIIIMQLSQLTGVWGGPAGYILILNTIVAEITDQAGRTAMFGRLQGVLMFGNSVGLIVGGTIAEKIGIEKPFELACISFLVCTAYVLLFVIYIDPKSLSADNSSKGKGIAGILGPLRILEPQKMILSDGRIAKHYGIVFLAAGIFAGVVATGYAPTLIQMYAMSTFNFTSTDNSLLISMNCLVRGMFLMFVFPHIISYGRKAFGVVDEPRKKSTPNSPLPSEQCDVEAVQTAVAGQEESTKSLTLAPETPHAGFDLFFLRWSLLVDGIITASSAFASQGWHMYLVGCLLPLASGSASAAKGVLTEMVPSNRKADALQAMTLVEHSATLSTMGLFGFLFSSFADVGKTFMTFYCNAAVAIVAVIILLFSRFPPPGSEMVANNTVVEEPSPEGDS
ncbi:hypothetical protein GGS21DRAFT_528289 [Xylaria nigripes]|nr:hypothetical protein GGS21DRAFT_528289 [Xylaria nigripes]